MPLATELDQMESQGITAPYTRVPGGEVEVLDKLARVNDVDKKEFQPTAVQQFAGRVANNMTFGLEQTIAKDGLVFLGDMIAPPSEKSRQAYLRRKVAEDAGEFVGEITAEPEGVKNTLGRAVRNTGWNWYLTSQNRMKELGVSWTSEEGAKEHPIATQLADASTSLLACLGSYGLAKSAISGTIGALTGGDLVAAVNAGKIADLGARAITVGGMSAVTGAETYLAGLEKGLTHKLSMALGIVDGTLEGALESWGLGNFLKAGASRVLYVARNSLVQGSEEFLQGVKSGVLYTWSGLREYDGPETYLNILSESLLAGAIGAIVGGAAGTGMAVTVYGDMVKSYTDLGLKKQEAMALADQAWQAAMSEAVGVLDEDIDPSVYLDVEERFNYVDRSVARNRAAERLTGETLGEVPEVAGEPGAPVEQVVSPVVQGRLAQIDEEVRQLSNQKANITVQMNMAADEESRRLLAEQADRVDDQIFEKDVERLALQIGPQFSTEEVAGAVSEGGGPIPQLPHLKPDFSPGVKRRYRGMSMDEFKSRSRGQYTSVAPDESFEFAKKNAQGVYGDKGGKGVLVVYDNDKMVEAYSVDSDGNTAKIFHKDTAKTPKQIGAVSPTARVSLKAGVLEKARIKALALQVKRFKDGVATGKTIARSDMASFQRHVVQTVQESEVLTPGQKNRLLNSIPAVRTDTNWASRMAYLGLKIKELENANTRKTYETAINNLLKKAEDKKLDPATRDTFNKLIKLYHEPSLDPEEFMKKWAEGGQKFEDILAYDIAKLNSGQASIRELSTIYDDLSTTLSQGVDKAKAADRARKEQLEVDIAQAKKDIGGEGIELDPNAPTREVSPLKTSILAKYTFDTVINYITRGNKGVPVGQTWLERRFNTAKAVETQRGMMYKYGNKNISNYSEAFGTTSMADTLARMEKDETTEETFQWEYTDEDGKTRVLEDTLTRSQIRKRVMEWQRGKGRRSLENKNFYTEDLMNKMQESLTAQDYAFIQSQFALYDELYAMVNPLYRKLRGADLPYDEFYSHLFAQWDQDMQVSAIDSILADSGLPTFMIDPTQISVMKRAKGGSALQKVSDLFAMDRYITDMSRFLGFANLVNDMQKILLSPEIKNVLGEKYSESMVNFIRNRVDEFRTGRKLQDANKAFKALEEFRLRMVKGLIFGRPIIGVKQLASIPAYMAEVPVKDFIAGLMDLPRAIDSGDIYKLTESLFMRTRGATYERDLARIKEMADESRKGKLNFSKIRGLEDMLGIFMKLGDRGAIYGGGWPLFRYLTKVKKMSEVDALRRFTEVTNKTQQSGDITQMPEELNSSNPLVAMWTTFRQAPYQYFNQYMTTIWSAGRMGKPELIRRLAVFHVILPTIWQFIANAFRWDNRDQARAAILGPLSSLFLVGDALQHIVNWGWAKVYDEKTPNWRGDSNLLMSYMEDVDDTLNGVYDYISKGKMKSEDFIDLMNDAANVLAPVIGGYAGVIKQGASVASGMEAAGKDDYTEAALKFIGYSDYAIEGEDRKKKNRTKGYF